MWEKKKKKKKKKKTFLRKSVQFVRSCLSVSYKKKEENVASVSVF